MHYSTALHCRTITEMVCLLYCTLTEYGNTEKTDTLTQTNGMEQQWSISVRLLLIYERHTVKEHLARTHAFFLFVFSAVQRLAFFLVFLLFIFRYLFWKHPLFVPVFVLFYYHLMVTFTRTHFRSLEAFSIPFLFYLSLCGGMLNLVNDSERL